MNDIDLLNLNPTRGFRILGAGNVVSSAGDINGDGINDVIVGVSSASPNGRSGAGIAYIIYGRLGWLTDVDLTSLPPAQGFKILGATISDRTGTSVSGAGDINDDGIDDVIVGAPGVSRNDRRDAGISYVIYGKSGGLDDIDLLNLSTARGFKILGSTWVHGSVTSGELAGQSVVPVI